MPAIQEVGRALKGLMEQAIHLEKHKVSELHEHQKEVCAAQFKQLNELMCAIQQTIGYEKRIKVPLTPDLENFQAGAQATVYKLITKKIWIMKLSSNL